MRKAAILVAWLLTGVCTFAQTPFRFSYVCRLDVEAGIDKDDAASRIKAATECGANEVIFDFGPGCSAGNIQRLEQIKHSPEILEVLSFTEFHGACLSLAAPSDSSAASTDGLKHLTEILGMTRIVSLQDCPDMESPDHMAQYKYLVRREVIMAGDPRKLQTREWNKLQDLTDWLTLAVKRTRFTSNKAREMDLQDGWKGWARVSGEGGITGVFRIGSESKDVTVKVPGLQSDRIYEVFPCGSSSPLFTLSGKELAATGFTTSVSEDAELFIFLPL